MLEANSTFQYVSEVVFVILNRSPLTEACTVFIISCKFQRDGKILDALFWIFLDCIARVIPCFDSAFFGLVSLLLQALKLFDF